MPRVSKGTRVNKRTKPQSLPIRYVPGFLAGMDGRTELAKVLKGNYEAVVGDIGGKEEVGHVKNALVERFVFLEAFVQTTEQQIVSGEAKPDAIGKWIQAVNSLSGLAKVLGIERRQREMPWLTSLPTPPELPLANGDGKHAEKGAEHDPPSA